MKIDNLSYEEALVKLEEILKELEEDKYTLKESIDKFKKGVSLYNHCNKLLLKAEGEVKIILEDKDGKLVEDNFLMEG